MWQLISGWFLLSVVFALFAGKFFLASDRGCNGKQFDLHRAVTAVLNLVYFLLIACVVCVVYNFVAGVVRVDILSPVNYKSAVLVCGLYALVDSLLRVK